MILLQIRYSFFVVFDLVSLKASGLHDLFREKVKQFIEVFNLKLAGKLSMHFNQTGRTIKMR